MSVRNPLDGLPAEAKARLRTRAPPKWVAPMLATLTDEVCSRQGWLFGPKWDGERCLAFRRGRDLNLFSRNRIRLNARYPEVVEAIYQQQTTSFIADGEIVTFEGEITCVFHRSWTVIPGHRGRPGDVGCLPGHAIRSVHDDGYAQWTTALERHYFRSYSLRANLHVV